MLRRGTKWIGELMLFDRLPIRLPWFQHIGSSEAQVDFTRAYYRLAWQLSIGGSIVRALAALPCWLAVSLQQTIKFLHRPAGSRTPDRELPTRARLFWQMSWCLLRHNLSPESFSRCRLYRRERWPHRHLYLAEWQSHPVLTAIDVAIGEFTGDMNHKLEFWRHCRAVNLPVVPVLDAWAEGVRVAPFDHSVPDLPPTDLVLKPATGYGGHGIEFLAFDRASGQWKNGASTFDAPGVTDFLAKKSWEGCTVLQTRLENHPDIARLSNGYLVTLRVNTGCFPGETPFVFGASFRTPTGKGKVANFSGDPLIASINPETGALSRAESSSPAQSSVDLHPDTGERFAGFKVPGWPEIVAMVVRAHATCPDFPTVGWDVVVTSTGPLLLEFNTRWTSTVLQLAGDRPVGGTRFVECCAAHLRRLRPDLVAR